MELDKTLEEITLQNNSLNNTTGEVAREYFKLRISNDKKLSTLKSVHNDEKSKFKKILKQLTLISIQKIDFNISSYKDNVKTSDDIHKISNEIYDVILNTFDGSNRIYYENSKEHIINYINSVYKCRIEMKKLNAELCSIINVFVKDNNIKRHKLSQFVSLYQDIKKDLQFYSTYCNDIEDFKNFQTEKEELLTFAEEIFLEEVNKINSKRDLDNIVNENNEQKDLDYKRKISKHYTHRIGNNTKEFVVETLLSAKNTKNANEEDEVETVVEGMLLNNKEINNLTGKLYEQPKKTRKKRRTKEEKTILEKNEATGMIALRNMFGGLLD
jgi:hypothetical protein